MRSIANRRASCLGGSRPRIVVEPSGRRRIGWIPGEGKLESKRRGRVYIAGARGPTVVG